MAISKGINIFTGLYYHIAFQKDIPIGNFTNSMWEYFSYPYPLYQMHELGMDSEFPPDHHLVLSEPAKPLAPEFKFSGPS